MRLSHLLAISLCGISTVACHVDEIEVPSEELFTRSFIKEFGISDPKQDWSLATRITANIDPAIVAGAETISIYDRMPGSADCQARRPRLSLHNRIRIRLCKSKYSSLRSRHRCRRQNSFFTILFH